MPARPRPVPDAESAPYWEAARAHRLSLPRCDDCGLWLFPPRQRCPGCQSSRLRWEALSGKGTVFSRCVMHERLVPGFTPPYLVAQVELQEQAGLLLMCNILDARPEEVAIGAPVEVAFEDLEDATLVQFRLART